MKRLEDRCVCDSRMTNVSSSFVCDIETDLVQGMQSVRLSYDDQYLRVHRKCPLDYCDDTSDRITFASPDEQCANHRGGVMWGLPKEL